MKVLFFSGAMLLFSLCVTAQTHVHYGLKAGLNVTNLGSSPNGDYQSKAWFNAGGLAHIHLNQSWALQPEIMYSGQGAKIPGGEINLHYINIPVQVQYMFNKGFRLQTGPQLGLLAAANYVQNDVKTEAKEAFKPADFGWTFGASYVGKSGLGVDGRYTQGITRINEGGPRDLYNQNFQLGLFYLIKHHYK